MLYLRNTNQLQTIGEIVARGTAGPTPPPPTPDTSSILTGLLFTNYVGYFNDNPNYFATATSSYAGVDIGALDFGSATGSTGNLFSNQYVGLFKASTDETYTFYLNSDDAAFMWIGAAADASPLLTSSALVNNEGTHSVQERTGSIALTSGSYYSIRIQYGENTGGEIFTASFSTDTISKTSNFTNYTFYSASFGNGLGRREWSVGFGAQGAPALVPSSYSYSSIYRTGSLVIDSGSLLTSYLPNVTGSVEWVGYFKPSTTETYTFILNSDDTSRLWIGNNATAIIPTAASALVTNNSSQITSASIALTSGSYYGFRIQYTAHATPDYFTESFRTPTISETTNFTNYTFHNTSSYGF